MAIQKNIKVNNPCEVEWESLNGFGDVRICQFCSKNVVDFTEKTEKEIIDYVLGQKGIVCGRLTKPTSINKSFFNIRRPLIRASILLALGINSPKPSIALERQMFTNPVFAVSANKFVQSPLKLESSDSTIYLRGRVVDVSDSLPLPSATIEIMDTQISTTTNREGEFELKYSVDKKRKLKSTVAIRFLGYETVELSLDKFVGSEVQIALKPAVTEMGEVVISRTRRIWWAIKSPFIRKKKRDN
uniref:carboxypeptidase-like regulatory domain-containing protein n=1 Tax=Roseivirga sp. TaxID=1964215 RepID=UPI0040487312